MLRNFIASFLLLIALVAAMRNLALLAYYQMDRDGFISTYCINKNRPEIGCNGQCKLAQLIKEKEQKEASQTLVSLQADFQIYYQAHTTVVKMPVAIELPAIKIPLRNSALIASPLLHSDGKPPEIMG
ncbi:MAG TPA: hypothetical protein VIK80_13735 [Flavihumibacter sp.]|jgi:hypothetical protein